MKNTFSILSVCALLFVVGLGCSSFNPLSSKESSTSNKTITDKGVETVVGDEKIGVPECDDVMDFLTRELDNPDDNFVAKAGKGFVLNKIKESVRESVEKNKGDTEKLAKECGKFKVQLEKYKAEEEKKKAEK